MSLAFKNPRFDGYLEFNGETLNLSSPPAGRARLAIEDDGSGKTRLVILFPTGVKQVIATEP